jgi:hypothetical protein
MPSAAWLWKNYGYPAIAFTVTAVLAAWQTGALGADSSWRELAWTAASALAAFVLTKLRATAGADEPWLEPNREV